jgi:phosphorylcholine metabolism protein LicD
MNPNLQLGLLIALCILLAAYIALRCYTNWERNIRKAVEPTLKRSTLITLLELVSKYCHTTETPIWMAHGTLLGYYRDDKIIEYDYDLDFGYLVSNEKELRSNLDDLIANNAGYKYVENTINGLIRKFQLIHIDTGLNADFDGYSIILNKYAYKNEVPFFHLFRYGQTPSIFGVDSILPIKEVMFEGVSIGCPNKPETLIKKWYGSSWKTRIEYFLEHFSQTYD